ncbi:nicotinamidase-related amidase [Kushneria sinocarnis]|uniref:Nicotinamidase-related amidase n=1 Tax=Kushneria sinocarnis TaxID=595502 RepID=A0A420WYZ5_9GAMM|nr:isochorismatase family protein [Kushneria sinocarnis]RKR06396.1 nicotinamidase-related amidase [Kushneria sinocarnis]
MDALLVIDMQIGICTGRPCHDIDGVINRINALAAGMRAQGSPVIHLQFDGAPESAMAPLHAGWQLLPPIERPDMDRVIRRDASDAFLGTALAESLREAGVTRLLLTGHATELAVDTTLRAALSHGFDVVAVADAHTTCDRGALSADTIIDHHQQIWTRLASPAAHLELLSTATLLRSGFTVASPGNAHYHVRASASFRLECSC